MEDGLVHHFSNVADYKFTKLVLILVVMEDGLVLFHLLILRQAKRCLNPCCNGRWSRTWMNGIAKHFNDHVS